MAPKIRSDINTIEDLCGFKSTRTKGENVFRNVNMKTIKTLWQKTKIKIGA